MDPIAHTFTGAALAATGLRRVTPLATAALVLGANAPDIDIVAALGPDFSSVAHRRGWTHGLPAIAGVSVPADRAVACLGPLRTTPPTPRCGADTRRAPARPCGARRRIASGSRLAQQLRHALAHAVRRPLVLRRCAVHHRSLGMARVRRSAVSHVLAPHVVACGLVRVLAARERPRLVHGRCTRGLRAGSGLRASAFCWVHAPPASALLGVSTAWNG